VTAQRRRQRSPTRQLSEREAILLLERLLAGSGDRVDSTRSSRVVLGIGDDAAVLRGGTGLLVWSVDVCVEGIHFERAWLRLRDVGWRSFQAALSDLAAMGARPLAALCSLILPGTTTRAQLRALGSGQAESADAGGCPILGGNISRGSELSVTTAVLGVAARVGQRSGARPGHDLWLVGDVGLAAAGLRLVARRFSRPPRCSGYRVQQVCVQAWRRPRALIQLGRRLVRHASAVIDVSDGVAGDAARIAEASGVKLLLEEGPLRHLLRPELCTACSRLGSDPLTLALYGGEDYALLAAGPPRKRPRFARRIGRVVRGSGVWLEPISGGRPQRLREGFDHLKS
jgi:thiamine-monophosphate kinase